MKSEKKGICATLVVCGLVTLTGCVNQMGNQQLDDPNAFNKIEKGKSTKDDVRSALGAPMHVTFNDKNEELWTYVRMKQKTSGASFIPVVGLFAGNTTREHTQITVKFDTNGVVNAASNTGNNTETIRPLDGLRQ